MNRPREGAPRGMRGVLLAAGGEFGDEGGRGKNFLAGGGGAGVPVAQGFGGHRHGERKKFFQPVVKTLAKSGGIVYYVILQADVAELVYAHV